MTVFVDSSALAVLIFFLSYVFKYNFVKQSTIVETKSAFSTLQFTSITVLVYSRQSVSYLQLVMDLLWCNALTFFNS